LYIFNWYLLYEELLKFIKNKLLWKIPKMNKK
jgi:hypothetical protein